MNKLLLTLSFLISLFCLTSQSWALSTCPSTGTKHNCYGSYTSTSGNVYIGEWQNNNYNGQGVYYFLADDEFRGDKYIGQFKNSNNHGQGTYYYLANNSSKGDIFSGKYKNGKINGQGTYTYKRGDKYVGQYQNNKRNGQGKYTYANGKVEEGIWKNDKFLYSQKKISPNLNSKIEEYKSFCSEIGFTPGTEKFGECVVEAMKKG